MVVTIATKQYDLPDFPTIGRINPNNFEICRCPQSKAIERGCNIGNCNNLSNADAFASYKAKVRDKLVAILGDINTEVNKGKFVGLENTADQIATYLGRIYVDIDNHRQWLGRMLGKPRKQQCCANEADLRGYIDTDKAFQTEVDKAYKVWQGQGRAIANLEVSYQSDVNTEGQTQTQQAAYQQQVAAYNAQTAQAAEQIASSQAKVSDLFLGDTSKRLLLVGGVVLFLVVLYFIFKKK
jgi:hypothetical protein